MTKLMGNDDPPTTEVERLVFQAGGELRIVQNNLDADGSVTLIVYNPKPIRKYQFGFLLTM